MTSFKNHNFRIFYSPADEPLTNFYIPALAASVRYDRSAGFFSSTALAVAAAGVAGLIQNGGRMRLLVGAALNEADVEAIRQGYELKDLLRERLLEHFPDPQDALLRGRLEILAWMVAEDTLEIRVVLPKDEQGFPLTAAQSQDYFHAKTGIFTDAAGDQIGFTGSVNESETAWKKNYENFAVYFSWNETRPYLAQISITFEKLWEGREPDWIAVEIPTAVRERLLQFKPDQAPTLEPLAKTPETEGIPEPADDQQAAEAREEWLFQFLRDAPYLPDAIGLGAATASISPWPHQSRVAQSAIAQFPGRLMFCDEVGLGKTIEAGLVLRQLLLSGRVCRCLILTPKSVLKQWQEELYEKFNLPIPRYDGGKYLDRNDQPVEPERQGENPWDAFPVLLAGSQLAKRSDRRDQILQAVGWDLVVVDEAHHARRKDFKEHVYRPNRLLSLLNELDAQGKAGSYLLMTATPMQVHPLEVWDLLRVLGMGGKWGADDGNFLDFFTEMRKPFNQVDWEFTFDLIRDELETGGSWDPALESQAKAELGAVKWAQLADLPAKRGQRGAIIKQLGTAAHPYVKEIARRHTPLHRFISRNTRTLLREYQKRGILKENVPTRKPKIVRVPMTAEEFALYGRIEEYISHFYQKYEAERRGLGFIMTVYRRRLTSSFYAVRCSLERRLKFLKGAADIGLYDEDDIEQEELALDISEEIAPEADQRNYFAEMSYLQNFLQGLRSLSAGDSKLVQLKTELGKAFRDRDKAIIFTQYTDTLDYLRSQLVEVYGSEVACYSGRGGEVWNGIAWVNTTKELVKGDFKDGRIRILLCTDSASEGLNLQTCGVLINYDMPWNPMRVEQRIGRIDRIGQIYPEVRISNYFYKDTIEDMIYQRLSDRINWFEVVVGELQPILAEIGEATRRLAMLPADQQKQELEVEINSLRERLQNQEFETLNLDEYAEVESDIPLEHTPVTLRNLEELLTRGILTGKRFTPHPEIEDAYLLDWKGEKLPVTFSAACFDKHPDSVRFISYGIPLFKDLLDSIPAPKLGESSPALRLETEDGIPLRAWYAAGAGNQVVRISSYEKLKSCLSASESLPGDEGVWEAARAQFDQEATQLRSRQEQIEERRRRSRELADRERGQTLLKKAAMVEIALGQQKTLFDDVEYPTAFSETAVTGLARRGYPWTALLRLVYEPGLQVTSADPYYQKIAGNSRDSLKGRFNQLKDEARQLVQAIGKPLP